MAYENESINLLNELESFVRQRRGVGLNEPAIGGVSSTSSTNGQVDETTSGGIIEGGGDEILGQIAEALKSNTQRHEMVLEHLDEVKTLIDKLVAHKEAFKSFTLNSNSSFSRYC